MEAGGAGMGGRGVEGVVEEGIYSRWGSRY